MMDVLIYLFESYIDFDEIELHLGQDEISRELIDIGFQEDDVQKAFEWLEDLADSDEMFSFFPSTTEEENQITLGSLCARRVYTREERSRLDPDSISLLLFLENGLFITALHRECILSYTVKLEPQKLTLDEFKWLILMVLFNAPESEVHYELVNQYFYDSEYSLMH